MPSNYENDRPSIIEREDGSWLIDGTAPISEFLLITGFDDIDVVKYQTMAGLVLDNISGSLSAGSFFMLGDYRFEIVDMDDRRIDKILVSYCR